VRGVEDSSAGFGAGDGPTSSGLLRLGEDSFWSFG
jgi:hypothetical protein